MSFYQPNQKEIQTDMTERSNIASNYNQPLTVALSPKEITKISNRMLLEKNIEKDREIGELIEEACEDTAAGITFLKQINNPSSDISRHFFREDKVVIGRQIIRIATSNDELVRFALNAKYIFYYLWQQGQLENFMQSLVNNLLAKSSRLEYRAALNWFTKLGTLGFLCLCEFAISSEEAAKYAIKSRKIWNFINQIVQENKEISQIPWISSYMPGEEYIADKLIEMVVRFEDVALHAIRNKVFLKKIEAIFHSAYTVPIVYSIAQTSERTQRYALGTNHILSFFLEPENMSCIEDKEFRKMLEKRKTNTKPSFSQAATSFLKRVFR